MKLLKNELLLYDFSVSYNKGDKTYSLVIENKSSKSQAISQLKRMVGHGIEIISITTNIR